MKWYIHHQGLHSSRSRTLSREAALVSNNEVGRGSTSITFQLLSRQNCRWKQHLVSACAVASDDLLSDTLMAVPANGTNTTDGDRKHVGAGTPRKLHEAVKTRSPLFPVDETPLQAAFDVDSEATSVPYVRYRYSNTRSAT